MKSLKQLNNHRGKPLLRNTGDSLSSFRIYEAIASLVSRKRPNFITTLIKPSTQKSVGLTLQSQVLGRSSTQLRMLRSHAFLLYNLPTGIYGRKLIDSFMRAFMMRICCPGTVRNSLTNGHKLMGFSTKLLALFIGLVLYSSCKKDTPEVPVTPPIYIEPNTGGCVPWKYGKNCESTYCVNYVGTYMLNDSCVIKTYSKDNPKQLISSKIIKYNGPVTLYGDSTGYFIDNLFGNHIPCNFYGYKKDTIRLIYLPTYDDTLVVSSNIFLVKKGTSYHGVISVKGNRSPDMGQQANYFNITLTVQP